MKSSSIMNTIAALLIGAAATVNGQTTLSGPTAKIKASSQPPIESVDSIVRNQVAANSPGITNVSYVNAPYEPGFVTYKVTIGNGTGAPSFNFGYNPETREFNIAGNTSTNLTPGLFRDHAFSTTVAEGLLKPYSKGKQATLVGYDATNHVSFYEVTANTGPIVVAVMPNQNSIAQAVNTGNGTVLVGEIKDVVDKGRISQSAAKAYRDLTNPPRTYKR